MARVLNPRKKVPVLGPDKRELWEIWTKLFLPGTNQKTNADAFLAWMFLSGILPVVGTFINFAAGTGENMRKIFHLGHFALKIAVEPSPSLIPELRRVCNDVGAEIIQKTTLGAVDQLHKQQANLAFAGHYLYYVPRDEKGGFNPEGRHANVKAMLKCLKPGGVLLVIQENPWCGAQRLIRHFFGHEYAHDLGYIWEDLRKQGYDVKIFSDDSCWVCTDINDAVKVATFLLNLVRPEDQARCGNRRPSQGDVAKYLEENCTIGRKRVIGVGQDYIAITKPM